jgi:hypothetical protein
MQKQPLLGNLPWLWIILSVSSKPNQVLLLPALPGVPSHVIRVWEARDV